MAGAWWRRTTAARARMLLAHSLRSRTHGVVLWALHDAVSARALLGPPAADESFLVDERNERPGALGGHGGILNGPNEGSFIKRASKQCGDAQGAAENEFSGTAHPKGAGGVSKPRDEPCPSGDIAALETRMLLALAFGDGARALEDAEALAIDASISGHALDACEAVLRRMLSAGTVDVGPVLAVLEALGLSDGDEDTHALSADDASLQLIAATSSETNADERTRKRALSLVLDDAPPRPKPREHHVVSVSAVVATGAPASRQRHARPIARSALASGFVLETPPRPVRPPSLSALGIASSAPSSQGSPPARRVSKLFL